MSMIGRLVVNAGMQPFVIAVVKIVGHAGLRVGQVSKNGPLAQFEHFGFEAGPEALGLGNIIAVAAPALRAHGLVAVEHFAVPVTAILPAAVGVHEQAGRGRLGPKSAQVGPVAIGQGQVRDITHPSLISLGRLGLVEQSVRGAAQIMRRVSGAWSKGLRLQCMQASATHGHA